MQVTHIGENTLKFILSNTDVSVANALRRTMISEIPCIAIDLVEIEESECPSVEVIELQDHFLAVNLVKIEESEGPTAQNDNLRDPLHVCRSSEDRCMFALFMERMDPSFGPLQWSTCLFFENRKYLREKLYLSVCLMGRQEVTAHLEGLKGLVAPLAS